MKSPTKVDKHIGKSIKYNRCLAEYTQTALAKKLGITFQQLQKYENATNRISASRLALVAHVFNLSMQSFYPTRFR